MAPLAEDCKDELAGFRMGTVEVSSGHRIATYKWEPDCGFKEARAVVYLLHGVFSHTCFEWLSPDHENYRNTLRGSLIDNLLAADLAVIAHDHPAHGRSSGLHAYVDTLDYMRDAAIEVAKHFSETLELKGKPKFLVGMSMGGTTAVQITRKCPDMFDGFALISPAVRPPDNMFGWYGRFLKSIQAPLGFLVPKLPVISLPQSPDPIIRDAVSKDTLLYRGPMRVRLGQEFLRVYEDIYTHTDEISFRRCSMFSGKQDNIVSPSGIRNFFDRIQCPDKEFFEYPQLAHEVMREAGCELARSDLVQWILSRVK